MDSYNWYRIIILHFLLLLFNSLGEAQDSKEDKECDLNSASKCITSSQNIFTCYLNPSGTCTSEGISPDGMFEEICNSMNYTINGCLMDMLGYGCNGTDRHGHYQQWINPINAVLNKMCNRNQTILRLLADLFESDCAHGSFMTCVRQSEENIDLIELISSEMLAETCTNLDLRLQMCLAFDDSHCKSLVDIVLALGKVFVENASCKNQPIIFVPVPEKNPESKDDRDCAPHLASVCFDPMFAKWNCLFREVCPSTNLTDACLFSDNAINTCGMGMLGYGCENTPNHYYQSWLDPLNSVLETLCETNNYGSMLDDKECWFHFMSCLQKSDVGGKSMDLITRRITPSVCVEVSDTVDTCLSQLNFTHCGNVLEIVEDLTDKFVTKSCVIDKLWNNGKRRKSGLTILLISTYIVYYFAQF